MGGWQDLFCRLMFLGGQKLDKLSEKSNLYQRNICCPSRLMKNCTYILENMLFKIPGLGSTKTNVLS